MSGRQSIWTVCWTCSRLWTSVCFFALLYSEILTIRKTENNLDALRDSCCAAGSVHVLGVPWRYPGQGEAKRRKAL